MLLSSSPRGSFSVPVHISLHTVRRRRTRDFLQYSATVQTSQWKRNRAGEKAKAQAPVSSIGEERAVILGFTMMAFSILMYFVVGIAVVKPCFQSEWGEAINCSIVHVDFLNETDDRRGVSSYPCLQVLVNVTGANTTTRLHYDEFSMDLSQECFYTPKKHHTKRVLDMEAHNIRVALLCWQGNDVTCHLSPEKHPGDAILKKRFTLRLALHCLLWPSLMLFGGGLLVGLVMLTQFLAQICAEIDRDQDSENGQTMVTKGQLYRLLHCRPTSPDPAS